MTHNHTPLFQAPSQGALESIAKVLEITARLFPVPASHKKNLPFAVRDLSRLLTEDRSEMARPYWASPALFSAYLHFFLPWNLFRLAWLLPGLDLNVKNDARILDLGSGPLTMPLALWCARPDLRDLRLNFTCVDLSMQAMEHGRAILKSLAGEDSRWTITLLRSPLETALHAPARQNAPKTFDCILAANVLNELGNERTRGETAPLEQRLGELIRKALDCLSPEGRLLLVEPGNRLGGKVISFAREAAIEAGCVALAPCPHSGPCPMRPRTEETRQLTDGSFSGWCHFTHPVTTAPAALTQLSFEAHLQKRSMALSCVLLQAPTGYTPDKDVEDDSAHGLGEFLGLEDELEALYSEIMADGSTPEAAEADRARRVPVKDSAPRKDISGPVLARVISSPIRLPDQEEPGRYACCEYGLALLLNAGRLDSGSLVQAELPDSKQNVTEGRRDPRAAISRPRMVKDRKSGAILLTPVRKMRPKPAKGMDDPRRRRMEKAPSGLNRNKSTRPGAKTTGPRLEKPQPRSRAGVKKKNDPEK